VHALKYKDTSGGRNPGIPVFPSEESRIHVHSYIHICVTISVYIGDSTSVITPPILLLSSFFILVKQ
jgi:hypothetical protein